MTTLESLRKAPFNLDDAAISWVETTLGLLSTDQKVGQVFNLMSRTSTDEELTLLKQLQPGGITRVYGGDGDSELTWMRELIDHCEVPPLVSGDLEGSRMSLAFGTNVLNPLGLAAVDDVESTYDNSAILAREGRMAGISWSFTPVVDINIAFRSAIVGTRSFGSDLDKIERNAMAQLKAFQQNGVAATVKHWPGEGYDDRDQHLVTTTNPLDMETWEATYGRLYRAAIDKGVMSVMSAHIALPAFMRSLDPDCGEDAFLPASINKALNITLLREKLGFNGLIVSDATGMAGLGAWGKRKDLLPALLVNGCDVILFSNDPVTDMAIVRQAVAEGIVSEARLDEAVTRVLGLKAKQGLYNNPVIAPQTRAADFAAQDDVKRAKQIIARAPTLVKDTQDLLPLNTGQHKRVLIFTTDIIIPLLPAPLHFDLPAMLEAEGFEVTLYEKDMEVSPDRFDLVLYLFGEESLLTRGHIFIDWLKLTGFFGTAMRRYWNDIPTLMISFGHPYYLYDAPRAPTYINAYTTIPEMQSAVLDCLMGRADWNRNSPVDPFCGLEDARY